MGLPLKMISTARYIQVALKDRSVALKKDVRSTHYTVDNTHTTHTYTSVLMIDNNYSAVYYYNEALH